MRVLRALLLGVVLMMSARSAMAFPIRVSTATEITLDPRVQGGRAALALRVLLRDDRRAAVEGQRVELTLTAPPMETVRRVERTDAQGECRVELPLTAQVAVVGVDVRFEGDARFAPASAHADVDVDAPFVTVELSPPVGPLSLTAAPPPFLVRVDTGSAAQLSPSGLSVEVLSVGPNPLRRPVLGQTESGGRAVLTAPAGVFPRPGIYQLRPRVEVHLGHPIEGAGRTVLVRADTVLTAVVTSERDDPHARLRGQLRTSTDEPIGGAPVRLMRGEETVAAARTDVAGEFAFELDLDRTRLAGATLRARFDPPDPWFVPAESGPMRVGEAPAAPIHWAWMVAPWTLLGLAALALALRRRAAAPPVAATPLPVEAPRDAVVRVGAAPDGLVEVTIEAFDRSSGARLPAAMVARGDDAPQPAATALRVARGEALALTVTVDGHEPRRVELGRLAPGRHRVRVGLLGWREAVFDRARPTLSTVADGGVIPTPREASRAVRVGGRDPSWVALLERGAYGREAPDEATVRAVERAIGGGEASANDASDAVDAVN